MTATAPWCLSKFQVRIRRNKIIITVSKCLTSVLSTFVPAFLLARACDKLKWLIMWPLSLLLFFTVPNCAKRRWERWFLVSFFTATVWIAGLSYIMVWMVSSVGLFQSNTENTSMSGLRNWRDIWFVAPEEAASNLINTSRDVSQWLNCIVGKSRHQVLKGSSLVSITPL